MTVIKTDQKPQKDAKGRFQGAGPGRPKGLQNKSTAKAREAIALFVDNNSERLQVWLDEIAATEGPKAAFGCVASLLEFHVPKLGRTELTGKDGSQLMPEVNVNLHGMRPPNE